MMTGRTRLAAGVVCASLVAAFAGLLQARTAAPARTPTWAAQVDAAFAQWDRPDSPECALGVYQDGRIAYARGYGIADLEHDAPITPDSMFYIGLVVGASGHGVRSRFPAPLRKIGPVTVSCHLCRVPSPACRAEAGRRPFGEGGSPEPGPIT